MIKFEINSRDVKNPLARFLLVLVSFVFFVLFAGLVLLLFLPFMWFLLIFITLTLLSVFIVTPMLKVYYRLLAPDRDRLNIKKTPRSSQGSR